MSTPITSTDPKDLIVAAKCFESCIDQRLGQSIKTHLLDQVAVVVTNPVCVQPTAPILVGLARSDDPLFAGMLQASWKQTKNIGGLIKGYIVFWGTTNGGPYPFSSGVLPPIPRTYTITGLTPGTTYYVVVQAITALAGCNSANSNQMSNIPGGSAPSNHLLTNLVSHWALESNAGTDDKDANTLSETGGVSHPAGGIIGNYCRVNGVGVGTFILNCPPNLQAGPGISFTVQIWAQWFADSVAIAANAQASATQVWSLGIGAASQIVWVCWDSTGTASTWTTGFVLPHAGWHHLVVGYDSVNKLQFAQMDNAARQTNAMASDPRASNGIFVLGADGSAVTDNVGVDEAAVWLAVGNAGVLTTAQVTALWNGGAGLPFASYQP